MIAAVAAPRPVAAGRPLRALSVVALAFAVWLAIRLPVMARDFAEARQQIAPQIALATPPDAAPLPPEEMPPQAMLPLEPQPQPAYPQAQYAPSPVYYAPPPVYYAPPPVYYPAPAYPAPEWQLSTPRPAGFDLPLPNKPLSSTAAPTPPNLQAGTLAAAAYARLGAGDKRGAVRLFDAALTATEDDPRRAQWLAARHALTRRWSLEAWSLLRDPGLPGSGAAASPVLGGGQSGGSLSWTLDPLAKRPVSIVARLNAATGAGGQIEKSTTQAAFGARWQVLPGVSITAERLVAWGYAARNDWALRLAAGADGRRGQLHWTAYGEAGVLGHGDAYAGGQARAMLPLVQLGKARFEAGPGAWASLQTGYGAGDPVIGRFDIGPSIATIWPLGRANLEISADYRQRIAGQAAPASGPALTLSTRF
jgi:hypothetical protein